MRISHKARLLLSLSTLLNSLISFSTNAATIANCDGDSSSPEVVRCLQLKLEESSTSLISAEFEIIKIINSWKYSPTAAEVIVNFKITSQSFLDYKKKECEFRESIRFGVEEPSELNALHMKCEIELNIQRIEMLKRTFPPLPVI